MEIVILGVANAVPRNGFENTHFAVLQRDRAVLVDCASNPMLQIPRADIPFDQIEDIILTHFHPDHVSGVPLLLMDMWLLGRTKKLRIHGLKYTLDRLQTMMDLFDYKSWPNFYPVEYHSIAAEENSLVFEDEDLRVISSPVDHLIPNIGLRFEDHQTAKSFTYSSDTAPTEKLVRLASGSDLLLHEASGEAPGHSTPAQAAECALHAGVGALLLIHYPAREDLFASMLQEARQVFPGKVELAQDLMRVSL